MVVADAGLLASMTASESFLSLLSQLAAAYDVTVREQDGPKHGAPLRVPPEEEREVHPEMLELLFL